MNIYQQALARAKQYSWPYTELSDEERKAIIVALELAVAHSRLLEIAQEVVDE